MSRIGKQQIKVPNGVTVELKEALITVKGPRGELRRMIDPRVKISLIDGVLSVNVAKKEDKAERSLWGTYAAHLLNMIAGVTAGFKKELEINGVGYRVALQGNDLKLEVGYSHPVIFKIPEGVKASVEKNKIALESADIELLGKTAAELRAVKEPEPYKGKGIKYADEIIRHKAGKAVKSGA